MQRLGAVNVARLFIPTLSPAWVEHVTQLSRSELGLTHLRGEPLSQAVADLSRAYTREREDLAELVGDDRAYSARLQFFLSRDLLKVHGPLAELHSVNALPAARRWRVLDLGAGLGTTSLGIARFGACTQCVDELAVTAVDIDPEALELFAALARDLRLLPGVPIALESHAHDLTRRFVPSEVRGPFELIVIGLALNELHGRLGTAELVSRVLECAQLLSDDGCLIILEPALRATSRALQALRDSLIERLHSEQAALHVFAPCLHEGPCPMRVRERDYCHERIPCELPEPLAQLAASAHLRERDLTYSYLTLHRQARSLAELRSTQPLLRAISGQLTSKGKTEVWLCQPEHAARAMRLDRHRTPSNAAFEAAQRGSVLHISDLSPGTPAAPSAQATLRSTRITKDAQVELVQEWSEAGERDG